MPDAAFRANVHISRFTCAIREGMVSHFLPHEGNGHVPHVLKHHVLASYSVIAILLKALVILAPTVLPAAAVYSSAVTSANIIKLTNVARAGSGVSELRAENRLASAAAAKANDILENQYFAHVSPAGKTPWDWIRGAGYDYRHAGENLAIHFFSAEGVQEGWMASPTHRQNILDTRYQEIGVGVQQGKYEGFDTVVVVQMFGTPKTEAVAAATEPTPTLKTAPVAEPPESAPAPAPAPAPQPEPQVAAAETKKPVVDEASVKVTPAPTGYKVEAKVENAASVQAYLGPQTAPLTKNEEGTWEGHLHASSTPAGHGGPQYLFVGAASPQGETSYQPVAAVIATAPTVDVFTAGGEPSRSVKFLGFLEVHNLNDGVRRFYLFAVVALAAALAIKITLNAGRQKHGEIAHTVFVAVLFAVLYFA